MLISNFQDKFSNFGSNSCHTAWNFRGFKILALISNVERKKFSTHKCRDFKFGKFISQKNIILQILEDKNLEPTNAVFLDSEKKLDFKIVKLQILEMCMATQKTLNCKFTLYFN